MERRRGAALLAVVMAAVLAGCGASTDGKRYVLGAGDHYVALGDSYTAAPGIGPADGDDGCFRSQNNYPHLVAQAIGLDLDDVSCSGASTDSIGGRQLDLLGKTLAPQLDAVDTRTDLVTVGIGGNNFALYNLLSSTCLALATKDPDGSPCDDADRAAAPGDDLASKLQQIESRDTAVIRSIQDRAPNAMIVVVGYPAIVPEHRACSDFPVAEGDLPFLHRLNLGLNDALSKAATSAGAIYVDVYAVTRGHDICSKDPWVAGLTASHGAAAVWHPYAQEQRVAASAVQKALRER
ncbi:hypothetical protein ACVW00_003461 [Marmoricola sp. URHA0025 HA25]